MPLLEEVPFFIHLPSTEATPHAIFTGEDARAKLFSSLLAQLSEAKIPVVLATQTRNAARTAEWRTAFGCRQFNTKRVNLFLAIEEYVRSPECSGWRHIGIYPDTGCLLAQGEWTTLCQGLSELTDCIVPAESHVGLLPLLLSARTVEVLGSAHFTPSNYSQLAAGIRGAGTQAGLAIRIHGADAPEHSASLVDSAPTVRAMVRTLSDGSCPSGGLTTKASFRRQLMLELWETPVEESVELPVMGPEDHPRMLMVCDSRSVGGAELNFTELASGLQQTLVAPIVLGRPGTPIASRCRLEGVPFIGWDYPCDSPSGYSARVFEHLISTLSIKALYSNGHISSSVSYTAAKCRIPHLHHVRSYSALRYSDRLGLASGVVCPSEFIARIAAAAGIRSSQILLVRDGLRFRDSGEEPPADSLKQPIVLSVGWIAPEKRQHILLDAFAAIAAEVPESQLIFAGEIYAPFESYADSLKERARAAGVGERVQFLSWRDDIWDLYDEAAVVVICNPYEAFGRSALEGLSCGCTVIVPNMGGAAEVILPDYGLSFPADNRQELSRRLILALRGRWSLPRQGAAAYARSFTVRDEATALASAVRDLLERY